VARQTERHEKIGTREMSADDDEFQLDFSDHLDLLISAAESGGQKGVRDASVLLAYVAHHLREHIEMPPRLADYMVRCLDKIVPTLSSAEPIAAHAAMNLNPGSGSGSRRRGADSWASDWAIAQFIWNYDGKRKDAIAAAASKYNVGETAARTIFDKLKGYCEAVDELNRE
jgi:hypothetical protein